MSFIIKTIRRVLLHYSQIDNPYCHWSTLILLWAVSNILSITFILIMVEQILRPFSITQYSSTASETTAFQMSIPLNKHFCRFGEKLKNQHIIVRKVLEIMGSRVHIHSAVQHFFFFQILFIHLAVNIPWQ